MTIERRLARSGFTLTRDYPVPVERVWAAFAEEDQKLVVRRRRGHRAPGVGVRLPGRRARRRRGKVPQRSGLALRGHLHRHRRARPHRHDLRHVDRRDPHVDIGGVVRARPDSTTGTRFTHIEHGVFFDQFWADGPNREAGSRGLLDTLGAYLGRADAAQRTGQPTQAG